MVNFKHSYSTIYENIIYLHIIYYIEECDYDSFKLSDPTLSLLSYGGPKHPNEKTTLTKMYSPIVGTGETLALPKPKLTHKKRGGKKKVGGIKKQELIFKNTPYIPQLSKFSFFFFFFF